MRTRITTSAVLLAILLGMGLLLLRGHQPKHEVASQKLFADPASCLQCHAEAAAGYAHTGMAHAFYAPRAEQILEKDPKENSYYHAISDTYYSMVLHDNAVYQRRWQKGFGGADDNVEELKVDFVMGSGNHARTYLHREADGTLIELPVGWYAENGGHLGMSPGYDHPDPATHQMIAYECMFCHNAYPQIPAMDHRDPARAIYSGTLPEGIDCQRCHGPGQRHVDEARRSGASMQAVRAAILNPVKLSPERQMEVCEQCHLETTSRSLPDRIRRYDEQPFGYAADRPLAEFNNYFERDGIDGNTDHFEIVSAPYRLRQSRCYIASKGALTCESCHDPHDLQRGPAAVPYYAKVCMQCHAAELPQAIAAKQHPAGQDCVGCHMPKRRTEDVVHVLMTDHRIQRRPALAGVLLAELQELPLGNTYRGEVKRYRISIGPPRADDVLYDAVAQGMQGSNTKVGIPLLAEQIRIQRPKQPEFSVELGDALRASGNASGAIDAYHAALLIDPDSSSAQRSLAVMLAESGRQQEALSVLSRAIELEPENPTLWYEKGLIESQSGDTTVAIADLHKTLALKPDMADAQNNLGIALAQSGDAAGAEEAFRASLVINPYVAATRANLGRLLSGRSNLQQAVFQLKKSTELDPTVANVHDDYATVLAQLHRMPEARREAEAAVKADPVSAQAHDLLGELLARDGETVRAGAEFEEAVKLKPEFGHAQLDLALILLQRGDRVAAAEHLQCAARSSAPDVSATAESLLQKMDDQR
jgi:predicted CXXCH cytochrome family protein